MKAEYETKIQNNPIELLKYINILIYKTERSKYMFASITETFKRIFDTKQKDNKNSIDYSKCLKQTKDILEEHVDKEKLGHYVENSKEFNNATEGVDKKTIKYEEFNKCMEYLLIANLDPLKYASLEIVLESQYQRKIINTPINCYHQQT